MCDTADPPNFLLGDQSCILLIPCGIAVPAAIVYPAQDLRGWEAAPTVQFDVRDKDVGWWVREE